MLKKRVTLLAVALFLIVVVLTPGTGEAGRPVYKSAGESTGIDQPKVVDDPETAYTYYADLAAGKPDVYQVFPAPGQAVKLSLLVPKLESLRDFTPSIALVGPGITPPAGMTGTLPIALPDKTEAIVLDYKGDIGSRPAVTEPTSNMEHWKGQDYSGVYPANGPYYIVVWDKAGRAGKYVMSIGETEDTGLFDIVKFPYTWVKLNLWYGNWLPIGIALLVLAFIVGGLAYLLRRRPRATPGSEPTVDS